MANVTITDLPALSTMTDTDVIPVVNVDTNTTQKITGADLKTYFGGTPGGSNTQVQFNDSDTLGGVAGFTFDKSSNVLSVGNVVQSGIGNVNGYNAYFSNNIVAVGTLQGSSLTIPTGSGTFYGDPSTGANALFAGVPGYTSLGSNVIAQFAANVNSYSQINLQNLSTGDLASADYIITGDIGTNSTYYADFGLASSTHNDPYFFGDVSTANDGYLFIAGNDATGPSTDTGPGNLILGSTNGLIKMFVGNTAQANVIATVSSTGISVVGNITSNNITTTGPSGNITGANVIQANTFSLPYGSKITEVAGPVPGNYSIALSGTGAIDPDQQLLVYPTSFDANHLHLTSGNLYNTELFLGNDNLYVKLANTGNIVINTDNGAGATAQWTFDTTGDIELPLIARINSGGIGNTNAAEFGTEVYSNGVAIVGSQIYMGAGTGEGRVIVNSSGNALTYLGVENPGFAGTVAIDPGVTSEYAIQAGANNQIEIGAVVGAITTTEYVTGLGVLNATGNINGVYANANVVVVGVGDTGWNFDNTGTLTTPGVVVTAPVALANLTAVAGGRAFVNNGNLVATGNFGAQIGAGGSNVVPVWSDGANWYIG